jgi:metaxin
VQTALALQLQHAARDELLKHSDFINVSDLEADAGDAFQALSNLLGDGEFFFGRDQPGLFDASVFAYTHLILEENLKWKSNPLAILLSKHKNLVQHQQKLFEKYF